MDIFLPDADRKLIDRCIENMMSADEEVGRISARLAAFLDSGSCDNAYGWSNLLHRLTVVRARMQASRDLLSELLNRATIVLTGKVAPDNDRT